MILFLERDHVARLAEVAGDIGLATVDDHVSVSDGLSRRPDRATHAEPTADIVQPHFENLHHRVGGVALDFLAMSMYLRNWRSRTP